MSIHALTIGVDSRLRHRAQRSRRNDLANGLGLGPGTWHEDIARRMYLARAPQDDAVAHMPSGPRAIATTPVRDTSTKPTGSIRLMKLSIFSEAPVISNTKCSVVASMTRARNASASRSGSM